jgi:DNA-binding CsgD family transcriptional regulator
VGLFAAAFSLSERELEALVFTLENRPRKEMARRLGLSINSIKRDCDRLHKNLGVEDRVEVVEKLWAFVDRLRAGK